MSARAATPNVRAREPRPRTGQLQLSCVFASTVTIYLASVLPIARREMGHWAGRVGAIPEVALKRAAVDALHKRGNIEGAALFATLAPADHGAAATRALVAFQAAYNYLDALSEQPGPQPYENSRRLHEALSAALGADVDASSFYSAHPGGDDDAGLLTDLVGRCRSACAELPSFQTVAPAARHAAERIVDFQSLNMPDPVGGIERLQRWATEGVPPGFDVSWWELAAASGSSLAVHALLAAAADPALSAHDVAQIEACYFPWGGALHSLLDSLVDREEDRDKHQRSLLDNYVKTQVPDRLAVLGARALRASETVPQPAAQRVILTAMCSYYLSAPQSRTAEGHAVRGALSGVFGAPLRVALGMFAAKRLVHRLTPGAYS